MDAKHTPGMRLSITKSRAGHYVATLRSGRHPDLVVRSDKCSTLDGARYRAEGLTLRLMTLEQQRDEAAITKAAA